MLKLNQMKVRAEQGMTALDKNVAEFLHIPVKDILRVKVLRQSIDARRKPEIYYIYTLEVEVQNQESVLKRFRGRENLVCRSEPVRYVFPEPGKRSLEQAPVIVGMGPAGLFCGYFLALKGYRPLILERGKAVEERQADVERFWDTGVLDTASNVQFGEGGAGAFSDGKLNTLVKDKEGRSGIVLETLVRFGAKESICYEAKPHIGTDVICQVVRRMRQEILNLGGSVRFSSCVTDLVTEEGGVVAVVVNGQERIPCSQVVLACGHSARDTFEMLCEHQVPMEAKAFAVGLRVEHLQRKINFSQYGREEPGKLGAAPYKVTARASDGRGVYSFCMCPGGYVVNASSEEGCTAVNGMSYSGRSGSNANSAVIVSVTPEDFGSSHPLAGIAFQRRLEKKAYELGGGCIPVQRYGDFRARVERDRLESERKVTENQVSKGEPQEWAAAAGGNSQDRYVVDDDLSGGKTDGGIAAGILQPQCKGKYVWAEVDQILPKACNEAFVEGMSAFGRQIKGFDGPEVLVSGVESRTSSPVRIKRDETLQSAVRGLYPCGEGAGYAGGIMSAAMDGLRVAEAIMAEFAPDERRVDQSD